MIGAVGGPMMENQHRQTHVLSQPVVELCRSLTWGKAFLSPSDEDDSIDNEGKQGGSHDGDDCAECHAWKNEGYKYG